jgi:polyisoprenoid-binding protein YceI
MTKQIILILSLLLVSSKLYAKCVTLEDQAENIVLTWTAFKTPAKVGVNGSFDKISLKTPKNGSSVGDFVSKTTFEIDTKSVNTKNKARDKKIVKNFFSFANDSKISGKFLSMKNKTLEVEITMNGKTKVVPMSYVDNDKMNTFVAVGHIDVLDFVLNNQLNAINKACHALHKGKTWNDVALKLEAKLSNCKK